MLLSQEEIKQQTRELWRNNFSHSDEFLDIYFDEKYADDNNLTIRHDGNVVATPLTSFTRRIDACSAKGQR